MSIPVLQDISVEIPAGQVVALVGPSGAGKPPSRISCHAFYDPQEGDGTY